MIILSLLINCFLFQFCPLEIDIVDEVKKNTYVINDSEIVVTEYLIHNQSSYDYYTWYLEKTTDDNSEEFEIKKYLFSCPKNGISLSTLLSDNIYSSDFKPVIGVNFIKQIKPGESFSYIFINTDDSVIKNIKYISSEKMKKYIGDVINTQFLYEGSLIIIKE